MKRTKYFFKLKNGENKLRVMVYNKEEITETAKVKSTKE